MTALAKPEKRAPRPRKRIIRTSRPAKVRKTPRSKLKRMADQLWSSIVRAAGKCRICGSAERLQAAHGHSRTYMGTRWDLRNGWCLCSGCHMTMTHNPLAWSRFLQTEWGPELYDVMTAKAQERYVPDYEQIIAYLKAKP